MTGCENTPSDFTGMRIDTICECGHASLLHARTGCALCPFTDRLDAFMDLLETQHAATQIMHAHVENLIERVYELEGGDEAEGGKSFIERLVDAQIDRRDAKLKEEREAELSRAHYEAKCNCGYGGSHDPGNRGCVLYSYGLTCRKCSKPIQIGQWRFGSRETGYEHMGDDCER